MTRSVPVIASDISPRDFFDRFVATRKPAILSTFSSDLASINTWSDSKYLKENAGDAEVLVEPIHKQSKQYGTGVKRIKMPFREFLQGLENQDESDAFYLTTQYDESDPLRVPPPLSSLSKDLVLQPALMGKLVLQQVNLWIGRSSSGSSSGLHHDYQDNLYLLLKGSKRFVLYPPSSASALYPHGKLSKVHENGVIAYSSSNSRADGLHPRHFAEEEVEALEAAISKAKDKKKRKALEEQLDAANDRLMDYMMQDGEQEMDSYDAMGFGAEDDDEEGSGFPTMQDGEEESEDEDDGPAFPSLPSMSANDLSNDEDEENRQPDSFSQISSAELHQHLKLSPSSQTDVLDKFPLLDTVEPFVVQLEAGQMLYLPASWWHEVTSTSTKDNEPHQALNYWFHPPDGSSFEQPYTASLVWDHIRQRQEEQDAANLGKGKKRATSPSNESRKKRKA